MLEGKALQEFNEELNKDTLNNKLRILKILNEKKSRSLDRSIASPLQYAGWIEDIGGNKYRLTTKGEEILEKYKNYLDTD